MMSPKPTDIRPAVLISAFIFTVSFWVGFLLVVF